MYSVWTIIFVIYFGRIVDAYSDGESGCYEMEYGSMVYQASFNNNSGLVCMRYCLEERRTHYAGTQNTKCFCFDTLQGDHVTESECVIPCPGRPDELCGGVHLFTVYDATKTTTRQSTIRVPTTDNITPTVISTSNSTNNGILPLQYIMIIAVSVVVIVVVLIVMLSRRLRMRRKRRKLSKAGEQLHSVSHGPRVELRENRRVANRQDNVDTESDTTATSRPDPLVASGVKDDYCRIKVSKILREDPTYSHVRNNQQGACALLDVDYSCLGRAGTKTNNEQSNRASSDYDKVQPSQSCHVQSAKTSLNWEICNDDVYDKLQNK